MTPAGAVSAAAMLAPPRSSVLRSASMTDLVMRILRFSLGLEQRQLYRGGSSHLRLRDAGQMAYFVVLLRGDLGKPGPRAFPPLPGIAEGTMEERTGPRASTVTMQGNNKRLHELLLCAPLRLRRQPPDARNSRRQGASR